MCLQEVHLVPLALPPDPECLGLIADAVAKHNTALDVLDAPRGQGLRITPWLASSLAPTAAAVAIQVTLKGICSSALKDMRSNGPSQVCTCAAMHACNVKHANLDALACVSRAGSFKTVLSCYLLQ